MEELYVEYLEDAIEEVGGVDKLTLNVGTSDDPIFVPHKNKVAADWEKKLANGEDVDVLASLDAEDRAKVERFVKRGSGGAKVEIPKLEDLEFADDYTKGGA